MLQSTSSLIEKRKQLERKYQNEAQKYVAVEDKDVPPLPGCDPYWRPLKLIRLNSEDGGNASDGSSSIPRSSQTQSASDEKNSPDLRKKPLRLASEKDTTTTPAEEPSSAVQRKRRQREVVYVRRPLWRLQESPQTSGQFWKGALICYWGYTILFEEATGVPPVNTAGESALSSLCESFDTLPVNWLRKFQEQAVQMGASVVVGNDWTVFAETLALCQTARSSPLPAMCIHICRPFRGKGNLQAAWQAWQSKQRAATQPDGPASLYDSLARPLPGQTFPGPAAFHRVGTPLWLQFCVNDRHHYPETSFVFFQPPHQGDSYSPFLFKHKPPTPSVKAIRVRRPERALRILLLGATRISGSSARPAVIVRGSTDFTLWQASIESFLGGTVLPPRASRGKVFAPSNILQLDEFVAVILKGLESKKFRNFQGEVNGVQVFEALPVENVGFSYDPTHFPDMVVCLKGQDDVWAYLTSVTGVTSLSTFQCSLSSVAEIKLYLTAGVPFVGIGWIIDCYTETRVVNVQDYLLNSFISKKVAILIDNLVRAESRACEEQSRASASQPQSPEEARRSGEGAPPSEWWKVDTAFLQTLVSSPDQSPVEVQEASQDEEILPIFQQPSAEGGRKSLALSLGGFLKYPQFPLAAFSMLPVQNTISIFSPAKWLVDALLAVLQEGIISPLVGSSSGGGPGLRELFENSLNENSDDREENHWSTVFEKVIEIGRRTPSSKYWQSKTCQGHAGPLVDPDAIYLWLFEEKRELQAGAESFCALFCQKLQPKKGSHQARATDGDNPAGNVLDAILNAYQQCVNRVVKVPARVDRMVEVGRALLCMARVTDSQGLALASHKAHTMGSLKSHEKFTDIMRSLERDSEVLCTDIIRQKLHTVYVSALRWVSDLVIDELQRLRPWPSSQEWKLRNLSLNLARLGRVDPQQPRSDDSLRCHSLKMPSPYDEEDEDSFNMSLELEASQMALRPLEYDLVRREKEDGLGDSKHSAGLQQQNLTKWIQGELRRLEQLVPLLEKKWTEAKPQV